MLYALSQFRYFAIGIIFLAVSCTNRSKGENKNIITNPNAMNEAVADQIKAALDKASANAGKIDDSTQIALYQIVEQFYKKDDYKPVWSSAEKWQPFTDSLYMFITNAENEGLFPNDYHFNLLKVLKDTLDRDSIAYRHRLIEKKGSSHSRISRPVNLMNTSSRFAGRCM